ncbi:unnamed protein product [Vicia faba]|uniref:Argonaute linker 2 domain-containing protein n=1 Tax=Vicia faba TaxID=3906 RepID=A0AAV0ZPX9_VICFA|nr:unnamed protein product [Vicia faba]
MSIPLVSSIFHGWIIKGRKEKILFVLHLLMILVMICIERVLSQADPFNLMALMLCYTDTIVDSRKVPMLVISIEIVLMEVTRAFFDFMATIAVDLCELVSLQRYTNSLSTLQRASLVEKSRHKPQERMIILSDALKTNNYGVEPLIQSCGITISTCFTQVEGRVLPASRISIQEMEGGILTRNLCSQQ